MATAATTGRGAVTLRPGMPADAPALARIHHAARPLAPPRFAGPHDAAAVAAWLAAGGQVTVAEAAGAAIGYPDRAPASGPHLHGAPAWQGQGAGARPLAAASAGHSLVTVADNRAARAAHARHGFRAGESRPGTAKAEGGRT